MLKHQMRPVPGNSYYTHECVNNDCSYVESRPDVADSPYWLEEECEGTAPIEFNFNGLRTFFNQLEQFNERAQELHKLYVEAFPEEKGAKYADEIDWDDSYLIPDGFLVFKGESYFRGNTDYHSMKLPMRYFTEPTDEALRKTAEEKKEAQRKAEEKERAERDRRLEEERQRREREERETYERLKKKFENQEG